MAATVPVALLDAAAGPDAAVALHAAVAPPVAASDLALIAAAVVWGASAGALLPRAVYRFAVPSGRPWRDRCPAGHPLRGWAGPARCRECAALHGSSADRPSATGPGPAASAPAADACAGEDSPGGSVPTGFLPGGSAAAGSAAAGSAAAGSAAADSAGREPVSAGSGSSGSGSAGSASSGSSTAGSPTYGSRAAYGPRARGPAAVTALACAVLAAATGTRPELGVWLLLAPVGVLLAAVDLRVQRLPDPLTLPLAGLALTLLGPVALLPGHAGEWTTALLGCLALGAGYLVLHLVSPGGMGFGDVKLALGAGAALGWYGWGAVVLGTFAGFLLGALYGGALVVARRADRRTAIPFGPFLIAGAFLGVLAGAGAA